MSNIQLHQQQITHVTKLGVIVPVKDLQPVEQEIINTYAAQTIRKYTQIELQLELNDIITICYVDLGYKQPQSNEEQMDRANEIWVMVKSIEEELRDKFYNSLRVNEVKKAIKKGSLGNYNTKDWQFIGVNVANVVKSIRAYLTDRSRNEEIVQFLKLTTPIDKKEPTEAEKFNLAKSNALNAFELAKKEADFDLSALVVYEFLDSIGLIEFDTEEKKAFMEEAKTVLAKELNIELNMSNSLDKRRDLAKQIQKVTEGGEKEQVIVKAKKLAVKSYFQSLIFEEEDLEKLINESYSKKQDSF